jgi:putative DNA primase/helicase
MDLRGRRWVVVSESDQGRNLAEATVKRLTGGDKIKARRMRQDFVEFAPSHTAALVTNHLPRVSGDDAALWARLRVVPFHVVIPPEEQDPHLGETLALHADAVLTWAVAGWIDYQMRDGLAEPTEVLRATDDYHAESDAITRFLAECCVVNPHMFVTASALWERWCAWRADDGAESLSKNMLMEALDKRGYRADKVAHGQRIRRGIGLAATDLDGDEDDQ